MTRTMVWTLALIALSVFLVTVVLVWPKSARSFMPTIYTAVPQIDFERYPSSSFVSLDRHQRRDPAPYASTAPVEVSTAVPRSSVRLRAVPRSTVRLRSSLPFSTGHHRLTGVATYYAYVSGGAAAARALREAIGPGWRGTTVTVWYGGRHRTVVLSDYEASLVPGRVIDLDGRTFAALVGSGWLAQGIAEMTVTW